MNNLTLPQYLIESSICLFTFYAFYHVLLKKDTFFQFNRFYLIATALFSVCVPFLHFNVSMDSGQSSLINFVWPVIDSAQNSHQSFVTAVEQDSRFKISIGDLIRIIYVMGAFIMGMKFLDALFKVFNMIGKGRKQKSGNETLVTGLVDVPASSFFSFIFWNDESSSEKVNEAIMDHELVHVRQWHSLDVICMEIMIIFKWFNPLIYLFRNNLRLTHEFIADRYVSGQTTKMTYANILLTHCNHTNQLALNNTFYSNIRERIKMLSLNQSSRWSLLKVVLVVPIVGLLLSLFAFDMSDRIDFVSENMEEINLTYDNIADKTLIDIPNSQDVLAKEDTSIVAEFSHWKGFKDPFIFSWGDMMYYLDPTNTKGNRMSVNSVTPFQLRESLKARPVLYAHNNYWSHFNFDLVLSGNGQRVSRRIKVNKDFEFDLNESIDFKNVTSVSVENLHLQFRGQEATYMFTFDVNEIESKGETVFLPWAKNNIEIGLIDAAQTRAFMSLNGDFASPLSRLTKSELSHLIKNRDWIVEGYEDINDLTDMFNIKIEADRNLVPDETMNLTQSEISPRIKRRMRPSVSKYTKTITETLEYDPRSKEDKELVKNWIKTLDNNDFVDIYFIKKDVLSEEENVAMWEGSSPEKLEPEKIILQYQISEYPENYEPNIKLTKKNIGPNDTSNYQIVYLTEGKSLIKLDVEDPDNEKILVAFSDDSKYEIIHIPNFKTNYRIIDYKDDYLATPREVIKTVPAIDEMNIHALPEFDSGESELQLKWGQMISMKDIGNFSLKQFHNSRKRIPFLKAGDEKYEVIRFTMFVIDKEDNVSAYQSASPNAYILNKALQSIDTETAIYFDDIIIMKDGQWQHVMDRFSFVCE